MRPYDPNKPIIVSHIPKTAGTSVRELFAKWYGGNLLLHYKDGKRPAKHDLVNPPIAGKPVAIYGHFTRNRGMGIEKYYPEVEQFVTIFREPLDRAISGYFFKTRDPIMRRAFWGTSRLTLDQYVSQRPNKFILSQHGRIDNFLPLGINRSNFKDVLHSHFVEVGVANKLSESMRRIAKKLGFEFDPNDLEHLNTSKRTAEVSHDAAAIFKKHHEFEYDIYNYVNSLYS